LQAGDRIVSFSGRSVNSPAEAAAVLREADPRRPIAIEARRGEATIATAAPIVPHPREVGDGFAIDYQTLAMPEGRRRLVITRPSRREPLPAVLIIGGLGCYPADNPFNPNEAQRALAHALSTEGYVTLRVEKTGAGDSEGPACATAPMSTEVAGLVAGLRWLKAQSFVDAQRVTLLGISMGGIVGPLVAQQERVAGLAFFEIVGGTSWFEYELENRRRQLGLRGQSAAQIDAAVRDRAWCLNEVMTDRRPRADVIGARPACERELRFPVGDAYMQDVFTQNIPELFVSLNGTPTLIVYGGADFITSRAQGEGLAAAVNAAHPGTARFVEIPEMDHWLSRARDQRASFDRAVNQGRFIDVFNPEAARVLIEWLNR
jgi:pimeloyl-ACP methyl ester carboxylesterase